MNWYVPASIWLVGLCAGLAIALATGFAPAAPIGLLIAAAFVIRLELGS